MGINYYLTKQKNNSLINLINLYLFYMSNTKQTNIQRVSNRLFDFSSYEGPADWRHHFDSYAESESDYLISEHNYTDEQVTAHLDKLQDAFIDDTSDKWEQITVDAVNTVLNDLFDEFKFEITGIDYPKYYNFADDQLVGTIELTGEQWDDFKAKASTKEFDNWLSENYASRSGFMSFIPDNLKEFNAKNESGDHDDIIVEYVLSEFYKSNFDKQFAMAMMEAMNEPAYNLFGEYAPEIVSK